MPIVECRDVRINYACIEPRETGCADRDPLVLVHGLAGNLAFWYWRIAPALARHHRVFMLDLRGHGRSSLTPSGYSAENMALDVREALDGLRIERAHLVGHSFGGNVALHLACRWPRKVASLTLADARIRALQPHVDVEHWIGWPRYKAYLEQVGIPFDINADDVSFVLLERAARLRLENPSRLEELHELIPSPFLGAGGEAAAQRWLDLLSKSSAHHDITHGEGLVAADIMSLGVPTLLVYGEYSHVLATGSALQSLLPRGRLEIVPAAGHFFPTKHPERLVSALADFLAEIAPVAPASRELAIAGAR